MPNKNIKDKLESLILPLNDYYRIDFIPRNQSSGEIDIIIHIRNKK